MAKFESGERVVWSHRFAGVHAPGSIIRSEACQDEMLPEVHEVDGTVWLGDKVLSKPRFGTVVGENTEYKNCFDVRFDATPEAPNGYALSLTEHELVEVLEPTAETAAGGA